MIYLDIFIYATKLKVEERHKNVGFQANQLMFILNKRKNDAFLVVINLAIHGNK